VSRNGSGWRLIIAAGAVSVAAAACGSDSSSTTHPFAAFDGCAAGAGSVIVFFQRTLDDLGAAEPGELQQFEERFDFGVRALLLRAPEVHCTEQAFNDAVIARVGELDSAGRAGELLIEDVGRRGLGSLDESRGGPLRLPGG